MGEEQWQVCAGRLAGPVYAVLSAVYRFGESVPSGRDLSEEGRRGGRCSVITEELE